MADDGLNARLANPKVRGEVKNGMLDFIEERFGDAGAIHRHELRKPPAGVAVDVSRDHVLAHTTFTGDQDLGRTLGCSLRHGEQFRHRPADDDKVCLLRESTGTRGGC